MLTQAQLAAKVAPMACSGNVDTGSFFNPVHRHPPAHGHVATARSVHISTPTMDLWSHPLEGTSDVSAPGVKHLLNNCAWHHWIPTSFWHPCKKHYCQFGICQSICSEHLHSSRGSSGHGHKNWISFSWLEDLGLHRPHPRIRPLQHQQQP